MSEHLLRLTDADLWELVKALKSQRVEAPFSALGIQRIITSPLGNEIATELQILADEGFSSHQLATVLEMTIKARGQRTVAEDLVDLVTSGPEAAGISNRDTSVVVHELFSRAQQSVMVAGYTVYQGQRVFQALADRMDELPELKVRMFLDIQRGQGETSAHREIVGRFADRFHNTQWPKDRRLPEVFFDPRALETDSLKRACLHAKCVVVDRKDLFVSSANFTEAAQERNLEVGLLIHSPSLAERVVGHFESLVAEGKLQSAF
jgi:phosphatidylserine/phosphatidylglycerophosphate/cardiolipin synthase-like enzyme